MLEITVLTYAHTKISSEAREKREKKFSSRKNGTQKFWVISFSRLNSPLSHFVHPLPLFTYDLLLEWPYMDCL